MRGQGRLRATMGSAIVLALALSGCLGSEGDTNDDGEQDPSTMGGGMSPTDDTLEGLESEGPAPGPLPATTAPFYLTADRMLQPDVVPAAGSISVSDGFAQLAASNFQLLEFHSEANETPVVLWATRMQVTLWVEVDAPLVAPGLFDFIVYAGSERSVPFQGVHNVPGTLLPGAPIELTFTVDPGDLISVYAAADEPLRLVLVTGVLQEDSDTMRFLFGGDTPTRIEFTTSLHVTDPLDALANVTTQSFQGTFEETNEGGFAPIEFSIAFPAGTGYAFVTLKKTNAEFADMDIVLSVDGKVISRGNTPKADETFLVAGPDAGILDGASATIRVLHFAGAPSSFDVTIEHAQAPTPEGTA